MRHISLISIAGLATALAVGAAVPALAEDATTHVQVALKDHRFDPAEPRRPPASHWSSK